jgi:hypothetical protein
VLPPEFKGILAQAKDSTFTEYPQNIVSFANPVKRLYPKTNISK